MAHQEPSAETTYRNYLIGFALSLITTFVAYFAVTDNWLTGTDLYLALGGLALVQMLVQLFFFLHLGEESRPRLKAWSFVYMTLILLIVVGGSLWIMHHLNYNMMEMQPEDKDTYMNSQKDKGF